MFAGLLNRHRALALKKVCSVSVIGWRSRPAQPWCCESCIPRLKEGPDYCFAQWSP